MFGNTDVLGNRIQELELEVKEMKDKHLELQLEIKELKGELHESENNVSQKLFHLEIKQTKR